MPAPVTIGVDVGGTKIAAGIVTDEGIVLARRQIPTEADDPIAVVAGITKVVSEMKAAAPAAVAVGVGAAGLIDAARGIVLDAPNIAWQNLHLGTMLAERVALPVVVDNDANVAAYGEALYGAGTGRGDQVMVTVGTGIGGGLIVGGRIYRGAHGIGAEVGHIILQAGGPACACGNQGCFEALASGTSIARRARERAYEPGAEAVLAKAGSAEAISGELVGDAAEAGDEWAREIVTETGYWLGVGLASLVNLLDPEVVVVGGGPATGLGEMLLAPAREQMNELVIGRPWRRPPDVVPAALGADAGIVGAAALARALVGERG